ncbi:barstar family protein [Streptomyces sp. NPDC018031]|uniref:barstar family protein n=1 Tax=Streptomyces sp. NPDC018031 TaxID=3365033 RepID=UPI0037A449C9
MTSPEPRPVRHAAELRLDGVSDKTGFLDRCARDLQLPDWFGHNWDALADALTDLTWWGAPPVEYVLRVHGWSDFRRAAPEDAAVAAGILSDAESYWAARGTPLTVVYDARPERPPG